MKGGARPNAGSDIMTYPLILSLIKSEQARQGLSNRKLAIASGITPGAMARIISGEIKAPSVEVILALCRTLSIDIRIFPKL